MMMKNRIGIRSGAVAAAALIVAMPATASEGGMPQLNVADFAPQLVWLAILFSIFYVIVSRVALPGIEGVLDGRKSKIDADLARAAQAKDQAAASVQAYETALADARAAATKTLVDNAAEIRAASDAHKKSLEIGRAHV